MSQVKPPHGEMPEQKWWGKPEFELSLRILNTALHYKQDSKDPRVFLKLFTEERKILQQALGLEE